MITNYFKNLKTNMNFVMTFILLLISLSPASAR